MFRARGSRRSSRSGRPPELSIWDPVHLGVDERGRPVLVGLSGRNLLAAGEPGAGKSVGLNLIVAHAALSADCRLILIDGKRVELGLWRACAESFIGPNIAEAIELLRRLQSTMDERYDELLEAGRRKDHPHLGCAGGAGGLRRVGVFLRHRRRGQAAEGVGRAGA